MAISIQEITDKKTWENFVLSQKGACFLQSWNWGECRKKMGDIPFRLGIFSGGKLAGTALVVKIFAKRGVHLVCPAGPLIDWENPALFASLISYLKSLAQIERALFIRVRPPILDTQKNRDIFKSQGFINAPMHLHGEATWELGIDRDEEEILSGMRKTTRNLIRRAAKEGVKVKISKDPKEIEILYQLQMETVKRQKFTPFSLAFFRNEFESFLVDNQARLFLAEYQGQIISTALILFYGREAVYHYAANSLSFPRIPASYLLVWEAIKEARKRGCKIFNFWGIAKTANPRHPWAGLTMFKTGFGGERVDFLHAQDLPTNKLYFLTYVFETLRRIRRGL